MQRENQRLEAAVWEKFHGPNLGYIQQSYEKYLQDPESVDQSLREMFEKHGSPLSNKTNYSEAHTSKSEAVNVFKVISAIKLIDQIRTNGHLVANIYPLYHEKNEDSFFDLKKYHLSEADLKKVPVTMIWENKPPYIKDSLQAIEHLKKVYTKTLAFEFTHIHEKEERKWLDFKVEAEQIYPKLSKQEKTNILDRLVQVEGFENFLHKTFVGQKRFSIEGVDMLVPMLDELVQLGCGDGVEHVMIGMAHRGRLNMLAHTLGKPYKKIFSEFHHSVNKDLIPSEGSKGITYGWTGDVKYHLGEERNIEKDCDHRISVTLANNPSHLEFINPIIQGFTRAAQEERTEAGLPTQNMQKAFGVLIHGDAAFPGEGVVAETLNLSRLNGYQTGGTIHIIANNGIGFTSESEESRSTKYASDLAKGFEIPIIHVNADHPESCIAAIRLAYQYRNTFKKDILIDLIGYRRYGHNEMDDPYATQPELYQTIQHHRTVMTQYGEKLVGNATISKKEFEEMKKSFNDKLTTEYEQLTTEAKGVIDTEKDSPISDRLPKVQTAVPLNQLKEINNSLLRWPKNINVYPKLEKILKRRGKDFEENNKADWALAETLAFATIIADGKPIRMTGQDSERGTFAHRHIVLHDQGSKRKFSPLHTIPQAKASFAIHNSPLSETAVLGFEYGYNVYAPETLVIWEAQFGDFVNVAQVIIDQFIASGRAKWGQKSSLVMLLPHGYEGQGPEHSSARMERFLQLAAENNCIVANVTSAAQYFHILRRQAHIPVNTEVRPLIMMSPKSLLRHPKVISSGEQFSEGSFQFVIDQPGLGTQPEQVERLILCSGKVALDLEAKLQQYDTSKLHSLHMMRLEQLYPFPRQELEEKLRQYSNVKEVVWVQEEPQNMGAWSFVEPRIRELLSDHITIHYIGRPSRSSPATGESTAHKAEQERIVNKALSMNKGGMSE
ncbi:2-oxoglutarate dehydrogenase E1 component [Anaerobacillus sp. MEB173]|uniref:2-oxoglutarate dehydrogenase E1 component n=1 Tax=Anaerobacillus sp. MEB173 TaxID=3383345 RepID=UPI003F93C9FC